MKRYKLTELGWSSTEQACFERCKAAVVSKMKLQFHDPSAELFVFCDASTAGWAVHVTQVPTYDEARSIQEQDHEPLAFLSGRFNAKQLTWSIVEKEAFAINEAITKVSHLLHRTKGFHLMTDHRNLTFLFHQDGFQKNTADRLLRIAHRLNNFRYRMYYTPGIHNLWADIGSRWGIGYSANESAAGVGFDSDGGCVHEHSDSTTSSAADANLSSDDHFPRVTNSSIVEFRILQWRLALIGLP